MNGTMLLPERPAGCSPALSHVHIAAVDIPGPLPDGAVPGFNQVDRRQTLVQAGGNLQPLEDEHSLSCLAQAPRRRGAIVLQLARDVFQSLLAFFRAGRPEDRPPASARLLLVFLGQFVH
jgi:hypothetical protein